MKLEDLVGPQEYVRSLFRLIVQRSLALSSMCLLIRISSYCPLDLLKRIHLLEHEFKDGFLRGYDNVNVIWAQVLQ